MKKTISLLLCLILATTIVAAGITDRGSIRKKINPTDVTKLDFAEGKGRLSMYYRIFDKSRTPEIEQILQTQGSVILLGKDSLGKRVWKTIGWRKAELLKNTNSVIKFKTVGSEQATVTYYKNSGKTILVSPTIKLSLT